MPVALRNVSATRRYPYLNWDFSHISTMVGRPIACLSGLFPPSSRQMDGEGVIASLSAPLHPVSYLRAVAAHAMLESEGPAVALAAEIGFDDAKLELLG